MKEQWVRQIWILILFGVSIYLPAQEIPGVVRYTTNDYQGDHQNWMITQDCEGKIYVANSSGVLIFNGMNWDIVPLDGNSRVRAVYRGKDCKIYAGGYETFGYIDMTVESQPIYVDITDSLLVDEDQEIWNIFGNQDLIIFQSFSNIYTYDYRTITSVIPPSNIMFGGHVGQSLYIPKITNGLYRMMGENMEVVSPTLELPGTSKIAAISKGRVEGEILLATQYHGIYFLQNEELTSLEMPINDLIKEEQLNRMIALKSGDYAIGTILNGVYITNNNFRIKYHINKSNGLTNNTVLSLFEDEDGDVWTGLDKDINLIKLSDPINYYYDNEGQLGTFFCYNFYHDHLYVGTNQGVFIKNREGSFEILKGSQGQAWTLVDTGHELICGHNSGSYIIEDRDLKKVTDNTGVWWIEMLDSSTLLQSTYTGLNVLQRQDGEWQLASSILNGDYLFEKFIIDDHIMVGYNPQNKIYVLEFNEEFSGVGASEEYTQLGSNVITSDVAFFKVNRGVVIEMEERMFLCEEGNIRQVDDPEERTLLENELSLNKNYHAYHLAKEIGDRTPGRIVDSSTSPNYIIDFEDGYAMVPNDYIYSSFRPDSLFVDYMSVNGAEMDHPSSSPLELKYYQNDILISIANDNYHEYSGKYEYRLNGWNDQWYPLPDNGIIEFIQLNDGDYDLQLRHVDRKEIKSMGHYSIQPIWYKTWKGFLLFAGITYLLFWMLTQRHNRNLRIEREKLQEEKRKELERERMKSKNEKLEHELLHKSKLLANSALTLAQKNEMLNELKTMIKKFNKKESIPYHLKQKLLHQIDLNINSDDEWEIFEQNFAEVHEDFLDHLKNAYPDMTPGELRLAAYIKMDLSSKEIAPLLNISVRSVENKRYRLRKKMGLHSQENLSEHLMRY